MADRSTTTKTYAQVATILGVDYRTVSDLVRAKGLVPKPTGLSGRAARTGLDDRDLQILRKSLSPVTQGSN